MLKDSDPEIARAERTLKEAGIEDWGVYQVPETSVASRGTERAERWPLTAYETETTRLVFEAADLSSNVGAGRDNHSASRSARAVARWTGQPLQPG